MPLEDWYTPRLCKQKGLTPTDSYDGIQNGMIGLMEKLVVPRMDMVDLMAEYVMKEAQDLATAARCVTNRKLEDVLTRHKLACGQRSPARRVW